MSRSVPYARVLLVAFGAAVVQAVLFHLVLHDWVAALNLATVSTYTVITLVLAAHASIVAIIRWLRRKPDDPFGYQRDFDLAG